MSKEINIARNITYLRKKHKITQEQLADAVNVTPQAVSKWETASCQPDTMTLPLIADFFKVSIDYLFYGYEEAGDDIYEKIRNRVGEKHGCTEEPYEEALKIAQAAQNGILVGKNRDRGLWDRKREFINNVGLPLHLMDIHGFSLSSPRGFSAIVSDDFLNSVNGRTMRRAKKLFEALGNEDCLRVTMEILNFHGISSYELKKKTGFDEDRLKKAIEIGMNAGFLVEKKSSHEILGSEYFIQRHHLNCFCLILASIKMIELSLQGATRMMYKPRFSMTFEDEADTHSDEANKQEQ